MESQRSDEELELGLVAGQIRAALDNDPSIDARGIQIIVREGRVSLHGFVHSPEERIQAMNIANTIVLDEIDCSLTENGEKPSAAPQDAKIVLPAPDAATHQH